MTIHMGDVEYLDDWLLNPLAILGLKLQALEEPQDGFDPAESLRIAQRSYERLTDRLKELLAVLRQDERARTGSGGDLSALWDLCRRLRLDHGGQQGTLGGAAPRLENEGGGRHEERRV